jgi:hypothetical protein
MHKVIRVGGQAEPHNGEVYVRDDAERLAMDINELPDMLICYNITNQNIHIFDAVNKVWKPQQK